MNNIVTQGSCLANSDLQRRAVPHSGEDQDARDDPRARRPPAEGVRPRGRPGTDTSSSVHTFSLFQTRAV